MSRDYLLFITQFVRHVTQDNQTGGTLSNYLLLKALSKNRKIKILSFDDNYDSVEGFASEGIEVCTVGHPSWGGLSLTANWNPFVQSKTQEFLTEYGVPRDVVVTTSSLPALKVFDQVPDVNRAVVVRAFENYGFRPPKVSVRLRINLAKLAVIRRFSDVRMMKRADMVITNSEFMRKSIRKRFTINKSKINIIPPLCDIQSSIHKFHEVGNIIGFVTRGSDKNYPFVLELAKRAPEYLFLIYGHTNKIDPATPKNVIVKGWESDRQAMLSSAAVWLMPSLWPEPFGRVSMEAQAAGRIALVINAGGLPETVADKRFVIDGFECEQWLRAIHEAFMMHSSVIEDNGAKIRAKFSQESHDMKIDDLFANSHT
ncbi:hypothetical protein BOW53_07830 [Solemya pervernicosa gill symbiont]|uniref:Glycosyl transferase family 1 domain-containing protein n=1 Tax=Solemya pervernicosa gill symbiont TaxID=642797 RepID=A0A1T2L5I4_9GAMM|nr:glycosyltransferase family 4 protein [Solemya pervernicosa gill symbiont]OOZ40375.1 hypothetical protein BOW53_07830 [Solemya pervernicosa gill symbiont]